MNPYDLDSIRKEIIGKNLLFQTPFGDRNLFYADFTASGRGLHFIEDKIQQILKSYANTHTEDDYTGKYMTILLHQAEEMIKNLVNAGKNGKIISIGSGATGALLKLQQILGIYLPPVTKERMHNVLLKCSGTDKTLFEELRKDQPIIFISPYEHHTNELMWRESYAEPVVIQLDKTGMLDLKDLEKKLSAKEYEGRKKLASFSAGSNITGLKTNTYDIAKICHQFQVPIMFDFAAVAPYVEIDMNRDKDSYFDAIFFSPHKFLGGPGTAGVLIFQEDLYRSDLPPTAAGGGTVDYVGYKFHDFFKDIETREKAGTPPILQTIKTAMVMELKEKIGLETIEERELKLSKQFLEGLNKIEKIELVGDFSAEQRVPIISFNVAHRDRFLHPKYVTKLLNDLFGIQSRAGCSCAGPYGHHLLEINEDQSAVYRQLIAKGHLGIKPGWVRVNIHYTFEEKDIEFLLNAIEFVAEKGHLFLSQYRLDMSTADWHHAEFEENYQPLSLDNSFSTKDIDPNILDEARASYFEEAKEWAEKLNEERQKEYASDPEEIEEVKFFYYYD